MESGHLSARLLDPGGAKMMLSPSRDWHFVEGADEAAIRHLASVSPVELPAEYLTLLRETNGGEGPLGAQPLYLQLDAADEVALAIKDGRHAEFFSGFIVIGSDGGGQYVALDARVSPPLPVVAIDMTNIDLAESVQIVAPDFAAFVDLIGREVA